MSEQETEQNINGWTFKIREDKDKPISWVYADLKNRGYNFATEISIEKIILEVEESGKGKPLALEFSSFEGLSGEQLAGFKEYNPSKGNYRMSVANFAVYEGNGMLLALKTKKDVLLDNNVEGKPVEEPLYLFFTILFGDYGNDPPHEFSGALQAARFTPAIRFETKNNSVKSIRVHYRFHFDLDSYLKGAPALTQLTEETKRRIWGIKNYASLLRDADHFPPSVLPTIQLLKDVFILLADVKFFNSQLDACNLEEACRFQTRLDLAISNSGAPRSAGLSISFRDPRTSLTDPAQAFKKTVVSLTNQKVGRLNVTSSLEYDQSIVDELAAKIFDVIVGPTKPVQGITTFVDQTGFIVGNTPLPGVSAACLTRNIKYCLVQLVFRNFRRRKAAIILKQVQSVGAMTGTDLADILKYLEPGDFQKVLVDIGSLARAILQEPLVPLVGPFLTLKRAVELVESIQKLAGKMLSIASFDVAEKPVLFEVVGPFVEVGEVDKTWDNLHWWGTEEIPSAPGAFHAVHSHYRWTQLNTYPTANEAELLDVANALLGTRKKLHYGARQLRSLVKKFADNKLSGPLIDPHIPKQTISLAIARNGSELDEKLKNSDKPFEKVSADAKGTTAVSKVKCNGTDNVYWLSCQAKRTGKDVFKGTLLVNGFYFAHDEEKPLGLFRPGNLFGLTQGVSLQKPTRQKPYPLFRRPSG